ncbi:MAG: methyltransferase [Pseudomonadota bacterium]
MGDLTEDKYLDGRVKIKQPREGYRAGSDAVMLAAAVPATSGDRVLELGAGAGVASACLIWRVTGITVTCIEKEARHALLAAENLGPRARVLQADLQYLPRDVATEQFDHVMFNPPYYDHHVDGAHPLKHSTHFEDAPFAAWMEVARKRVRPKGTVTVIHRAERLDDVLQCFVGFGDVRILPISARNGRVAKRVIVQGRRGAAAGCRLLFPFVMHNGAEHISDGDDYSDAARRILREGHRLEL